MIYIIILLSTALSAFFSGAEIAFTSANKMRLGKRAEAGDKISALALKIVDSYSKMLSTILIGNNLVNILASSAATLLFIKWIADKDAAAAISTAVMTVVILIFGEIGPKIICAKNAEGFSRFAAVPVKILMIIFWPVIIIVMGIVNLLSLMWKKSNGGAETPTVTEDELVTIIETVQEEGVIDEDQSEMMQSAIEFADMTLSEIITHRRDMLAIDINDDFETIKETALNSTYSRIPVYDDGIDDIIGVLYLNHFLKALSATKGEVDIRSLLIGTVFFHKAVKLPEALNEMRRRKVHLAIVTDEYGGTLGIVTMEDILEQIVGDIWDESDVIEHDIVKTGENTYEISGDMGIWEFFDELDINDRNIDTEYSSVGGWAIEMLSGMPHEGDSFDFRNLYIVITKMNDMRVVKLSVTVKPDDEYEEIYD